MCLVFFFPPAGHLPNPGIKPASPALASRFFTTGATREVQVYRRTARFGSLSTVLAIGFKSLSKMALNLYSPKQCMKDLHPQYPLFTCKVNMFFEFISHLGCIFTELPFIFLNCLLALIYIAFLELFTYCAYRSYVSHTLQIFLPDCCLSFSILSLAAAAAKSLQLCPSLCDPRDGSPPGSSIPGILQARTLEWVAISFSNA